VLVAARERAAAVQYGAQPERFHVVRRHVSNVGLHHLRHFLFERQVAQYIRYARLNRRIPRHFAWRRGPDHGPLSRLGPYIGSGGAVGGRCYDVAHGK